MASEPKNTYGFFNHFVMSPAQKETAQRYGLVIDYKGNGHFDVSSKSGGSALKEIIAPFAEISEGGSASLYRRDLKAFLNFLRQPIAQSVHKDKRITGHAVTRFMTTGHVEIQKYLDEGLASAASLECHEKGERKMKESDIWRYEPEFWNPDMNSEKVSSIPGTSYDPDKGFVFELDDDFINGRFLQKPNRRELAGIIKRTLQEIKGDEISDKSVFLNASEIKSFYKEIETVPGIDNLIKRARIEEKAQAKLESIRQNARELKSDARFQIAVHGKDQSLTDALKFDNLIQASSSLTPIVASQTMFDTWRHSHRTEHWMKLSDPAQDVHEEMQVFNMVLQDIRNSQDVDVEHLQAIIHNFRPLVAFASDLIQSMQEGADHRKIVKAMPEGRREIFKTELSALSEAFRQASVNGVEAGDLDGDYEELLTGVGNVLGQNGSLAKQQLSGYVDMMVGFWKGVGESAFDSPWVAGALVGFVGYAWYTKYGVDPALAQQATEMVFGGVDGGAWGNDFTTGGNFSVPQDFLDSFSQNSTQIIDEARNRTDIDDCLIDANCHYNYLVPQFVIDTLDESVGQYLKFRHYVGSDIIASNAQTVVELLPSSVEVVYDALDIPVNENTVFRDVVANVTHQGGLFVIDANMFQDGSHASMLAYGVTRAGKHGFSAFKGMGGLAAEFLNPAYRIGQAALSPFKRATANIGYMSGWMGEERFSSIHQSARPEFETRMIETAMTKIRGIADKIVPAGGLPQISITEGNQKGFDLSISIGRYGLKRETITLTDATITDLQDKLNKFALVLKYSAGDIGIESEPYTEFVLGKLENMENALKAYKASDADDRLQILKKALNGDLQHVIGAELKFNGRDQLYRTLFNDPEENSRGFLKKLFTEKASVKDDRRYHVLARHASKKEGRLIRREYRADMRKRAGNVENRFQKPERLASLQSLKFAWGQVGKYASKVKYTGVQALNYAWGGIIFAAREGIQEPFNQIPNKGKLALVFGAACLGGMVADVAGLNNMLVDTFSAAGASVSGITATGIIAGLMNIPQDLGLHTAAISVSALAVGVPWYYAVQKGLKPALQGVSEKLSLSSP